MRFEPGLVPAGPRSADVGERSSTGVATCGAELVGLAERFYVGMWAGALVFVTLSAFAALVLLPVRSLPQDAPMAPAIAVTSLLVILPVLALWHCRATYCFLRRHPRLELAAVLVAAALVVHPDMAGELWWPSCAILMALAILAPQRRTIAYIAIILASNLAGHLVAADLGEQQPVAIIGLWIGYPIWVGTVAVLTERFGAHLLRLEATPAPQRQAPRRVTAWTTPERNAPASSADGPVDATNDIVIASPQGPETARPSAAERLTARQLEVVLLLADGLRHRAVADCLSVSERQVQRHVAQAVARLGVRNSYELVALVVGDRVAPDSSQDGGVGAP